MESFTHSDSFASSKKKKKTNPVWTEQEKKVGSIFLQYF